MNLSPEAKLSHGHRAGLRPGRPEDLSRCNLNLPREIRFTHFTGLNLNLKS